ncbi:MAG: DUF2726 domain-containing protein [Pirellulaceae bacterium]|nr:DUF2726 domain-containing protein [Planctomycetales bacterium]
MDFITQYGHFLAAAVVFVIVVLLGRLWPAPPRRLPYELRASLLTAAEQRFYGVLLGAIGDRCVLLAMVRLADIIRVAPGAAQRQSWQNRIHAKHIDFVLCDTETFEPTLAIELDDRSHQRADRIERDAFIEQALSDAGLPLLRIPVQRDYSAAVVRQDILRAIETGGVTQSEIPSADVASQPKRRRHQRTGQTSNHSRP